MISTNPLPATHEVMPARCSFDARFVRMWRLYLAGSIAGFTTGTLQLFQMVFALRRNDDLPRTRAHLYRG